MLACMSTHLPSMFHGFCSQSCVCANFSKTYFKHFKIFNHNVLDKWANHFQAFPMTISHGYPLPDLVFRSSTSNVIRFKLLRMRSDRCRSSHRCVVCATFINQHARLAPSQLSPFLSTSPFNPISNYFQVTPSAESKCITTRQRSHGCSSRCIATNANDCISSIPHL